MAYRTRASPSARSTVSGGGLELISWSLRLRRSRLRRQRPDQPGQIGQPIRLNEEPVESAPGRRSRQVTGRHDDLQLRPALADEARKPRAVHRARHSEIGYHDVDGCAGLKNGSSFVAIDGFDDPETLFAKRFGNVEAHQKFI